MADQPHNDKMPKDPYNLDQAGTYYTDLYHTYRTCVCGTHAVEYRDPTQKNNHDIETHPNGSYNFQHQNGGGSQDEYSAHFSNRHHRNYVSAGYSRHQDGHCENCSLNTHNTNVGGERYNQTANNRGSGATGKDVSLSGDVAHVSAKSNSVETSGGEGIAMSSTISSQHSNHCDGDHCRTSGNTNYRVYGENHGSLGTGNVDHAATKSMQQQALQGNLYLSAKKGAIQANAQQKIILKVGQSTITIEAGQVTINSQMITLNGTCYLGGQSGQLCGTCGGGCATKVYVV